MGGSCCCCATHDPKTSIIELMVNNEKDGFLRGEIMLKSSEQDASDVEDGFAVGKSVEEKRIRRSETFQMMNSVAADDTQETSDETSRERADSLAKIAKSTKDVLEQGQVVRRSRGQSADLSPREEEILHDTSAKMLKKATHLIDHAYDLLPAESILAELESLLGKEKFVQQVVKTDIFERLCRKLDYFYDAGVSCCSSSDDWLEVYSNNDGKEKIHGQIDPTDSRLLHYRVYVEIPTSLINVIAVANEFQLMQKWNQLVVAPPEILGRRTAHYVVLSYQVSALGGLYKADVLNEIRRFSDQDAGLLIEYITSVPKDHPSYREPPNGYKRMQTILKNLVIACGPNHCALIQTGKLKMPFSITNWQAKTIGQLAGKFIIGGLVKNSLRAEAADNIWASAVAEDKFGFYERLKQCVDSKESENRCPKKDGSKTFRIEDIQALFKRRRFHRSSARGGANIPNFT